MVDIAQIAERVPPIESDKQALLAAFDKIFVEHPGSRAVKAGVDLLMEETRLARAERHNQKVRGGASPLEELRILPIIGPSGTTKTRSFRYAASRSRHRKFIMSATCNFSETANDLRRRILKASRRDPKASRTKKRRPLIVALDEAHHLVGAANADAVLSMLVKLDRFALVLVGTEPMCALWRQNGELRARLKKAIHLGPSDGNDAGNRENFFAFLAMFECKMLESNVVDRRLGLAENPKLRDTMYEAGSGIVGNIPRILRMALDCALSDSKEIRSYLTPRDVDWACQRLNPSRLGGNG